MWHNHINIWIVHYFVFASYILHRINYVILIHNPYKLVLKFSYSYDMLNYIYILWDTFVLNVRKFHLFYHLNLHKKFISLYFINCIDIICLYVCNHISQKLNFILEICLINCHFSWNVNLKKNFFTWNCK